MKIKVTNAKTVDNKPVKAGDVVEVDRATARNLINKGFAEPHDAEAKDLDLKTRSIVTKRMAADRSRKEATRQREASLAQRESLEAELAA